MRVFITACTGQIANLAVNLPTASYLWSTGSVTSSVQLDTSGTYWLDVTLKGCTKRDSVVAKFYSYPVVNLGIDITLCENQTILLDAGNAGSQYLWQDGSKKQTCLVSKKGTYYVKVDNKGCVQRDTINISYNYRPKFNLRNEETICEGQTIILKPLVNDSSSLKYLWQDGSANSSFVASLPGFYSVQITNFCGSEIGIVEVIKGICQLYVPNAFSPNGDGHNDIFRALYGENITKFRMEIFNRWGQKVFESNDIKMGWDGTFQENRLTGVYAWVIKYDSLIQNNQVMRGTVILLR